MPKKILQITHKPAYPAIDGGCLEMAKMTQFYLNHSEFDLSIFTLCTYKHPWSRNAFAEAGISEDKIEAVKVNTKPTIWAGIKALFTGKSFNLSRFHSPKVTRNIAEILQQNEFDVIQFESIFSAQLWEIAKTNSNAELILNAPNIEHELWEQYTKAAKGVKKPIFKFLTKKLKSEEIKIWKEMDAIFCITPEVEQSIVSFVPIQTKVLPFFVENTNLNFVDKNKKELSFFHIGAMDWKPNKEGVTWFIHQIWNDLSCSSPLHLAGKGMGKTLFSSKKVKEHGFVSDAKSFMQEHDVMVVPLLNGSGMRIKIIEAMSLGKCVISTAIGAEGIASTPNKNIIIANTTDEFKRAILELNSNPDIANKIGQNAKLLIDEKYSASALEKEILPFINSILNLEK